jgi:hypothetical protein
MALVDIDDILAWIDDVHEEFQREEDQGILQCRLDKASAALAGKDACERLRRQVKMRQGFRENVEVIRQRKKRG